MRLVRRRRRPVRSWEEKLAAYRGPVDDYYEADRFREFCDRHLAQADECMAAHVGSDEFDDHLVATIRRAFPPHEHEEFIARYRDLLGAWSTTRGGQQTASTRRPRVSMWPKRPQRPS